MKSVAEKYRAPLQWLETQHEEMVALVERWASINSGSRNLDGLAKMRAALRAGFSSLEASIEDVCPAPQEVISNTGNTMTHPLGSSLWVKKKTAAPLRVLLSGHMDTVFGYDHPFQKVTKLDQNTLQGPGVSDLKGGLVVMLKSLEALEKSSMAHKLGWQAFINADEEIGSPGSSSYLETLAGTAELGLVFEPALAKGEFASYRMGSANYVVIATGVAAHMGRDPEKGRNAIFALAQFVTALEKVGADMENTHMNVGQLQGGHATNIVPDTAICKINLRAQTDEAFTLFEKEMQQLVLELNQKFRDGIQLTLHPTLRRPPKHFDEKHQKLFENLKECGEEIGVDVSWNPTGGVCDGNTLAAAGLPTIDTMGVRGGGLHTDEEFILLDSLVERAKLATLLIMKLAEGEITL